MKIMKITSKNNCFVHFFHFRAFTILGCKNQQQFSKGSVLIYFSAMLIDFGPPFESSGLQNSFPSHETISFLQFFWNKARHQVYRLWTSIQEFLAPRSPPKNETNYFYNSFETMHIIRDQSSLWTPRADSRTRCAPQCAGVLPPAWLERCLRQWTEML